MRFLLIAIALLSVGGCGRESGRATVATPPPSPATATSAEADTLTAAHAIDLVGRHLTAANVYPNVSVTCLNLAARGHRDGGWVIEAFDGCSLTEVKTHPSLGMWHIDSVTKQVRALERPVAPEGSEPR